MIRFTLLSLRNFLSYGAEATVILLDRPGTTFVRGENLDNTGTSANGTGKTVIINALAYGCYDQPVSAISLDNLVNNVNKKHMEVIVEFDKNGKHYRIRRVRKEKEYAAGNYVELFEDGVEITRDSVKNTNEEIVKILGVPYELFVRIVVFSATNTPFLDLPLRSTYGPNQTDIIEELFDLKTLSEKAEILKNQTKEVDTELEKHKSRITQLEQEHGRHQKQLQSAKQRVITWEETTKQEIDKLKEKLEHGKVVDIEGQRVLHDQRKQHVESKKETNRSLQETTRKLDEAKKQLSKATSELEHLFDAKCPYCKQHYTDNDHKVQETERLITATKLTLTNSEERKRELEEQIRLINREIDTIDKLITIPDLENVLEIQSKSSEYERRISELERTVNPYIEPLDELEAIQLESINYDEINKLTQRSEHMKFLYKLLTKKDSFVRKVLLNKNLPFLNQRLQEYLNLLGLTHQVEFTHAMSAKITQFGRELDFGNLSHGQRSRVNLALSFAFRDVLQSLHERINVCMLDEVLDVGLDGIGVTAAARMLKRKARDENLSLYIISHRDEIDSAFDRTMTVQLHEGFSSILEE